MSGHGLPMRPESGGSPMRSPERERSGGFPSRHEYDSPYRGGYEGPSDRHYDGRREDERWADDYDRKRRRSPSPSYPYTRPRHRSPSPPGRYRNPSLLPDPASLENLLNFKQFAEWFRQSHPQTARDDDEDLRKIRTDVEKGILPESVLLEKHGMAKRYERYRKEFTSRQLFTIYLTHRDEAWFKERYSPSEEAAALRLRVNRQGRVPCVQQYITELRDGKWDDVNFDQTDETKEPQEEPEGLNRALGDDAFDPLRVEVPPRPGQVFVKTVPPSTGRKDLESIFAKHPGFQWLALSEPSSKRSFHRVGWAQYEDGVDVNEAVTTIDGSKVDNFTFHMGVNATPIVGRLRTTPAVASTLQRLEIDARRAKELAVALEDELLDEDTPPPEGEQGESEGKEAKSEAPGLRERGTEAVADVITRLLVREGLDGEDLDEEQRTRKAKITLDQYLSYLRHGLNSCYYCVVPTAFPEELQRKCVGHHRAKTEPIVAETTVAEPETERTGDDEEKPQGEGEESEPREAAEGERRDSTNAPQATSKKYTFPTKSNDELWVERLDLKVRALTEDVDVVDYCGRDIEDETKRLTAPSIKQEEADKYRCKQCMKLFRAPEFVIKHIMSKHPEVVKDKIDDLTVFNNFVLDPQHIQPSAQTPAAVDDQLPLQATALPAFNPTKAMFNPAAANQPGFNMAMQQQMMMMMHMQMMMSGNSPGSSAVGGSKGQTRDADPSAAIGAAAVPGLPPPPPGGEDPRARKGRLSYRDLDEPSGAGDGGLPY